MRKQKYSGEGGAPTSRSQVEIFEGGYLCELYFPEPESLLDLVQDQSGLRLAFASF